MKAVVGGWVCIKDADSRLRLWAERHLVVRPRQTYEMQSASDLRPISVFRYKDGDLYLPRALFAQMHQSMFIDSALVDVTDISIEVSDGTDIDVAFNGSFRGDQREAVETVLAHLYAYEYGDGVLHAPGGWGKTVWATQLISAVKKTALVVVHKTFLMRQWVSRLGTFLPDAKVGIVQQDRCEFDGMDIVVMSVQSATSSTREYPSELYSWPGLVIVDEVHRFGARLWNSVIPEFGARYRIGLSATPRRKDGCWDLVKWHLGDVIYSGKISRVKPKVKRIFTGWVPSIRGYVRPSDAPRHLLIRHMIEDGRRNRIIIEELVKAVGAGRKILVFSERLEHLRTLDSMLQDCMGNVSTAMFVGGMSFDEEEKAKEAQVLFCTYQKAAEGFDLDAADTEFLATPVFDVEQVSYRITRELEGKKTPIIVDFVDSDVDRLAASYRARMRYYTKIDAIQRGQ